MLFRSQLGSLRTRGRMGRILSWTVAVTSGMSLISLAALAFFDGDFETTTALILGGLVVGTGLGFRFADPADPPTE